jgi:plastocyanin
VIHVGETVEWTISEAVTNHTITFGPEPDALHQIPPSANVTVDADGARHAYISSPSDAVHSGFITQAPQDRIGLAQAPLGVTRFRVTFTQPGIYLYKCVLHDNLAGNGRESHRSSLAPKRWRGLKKRSSTFHYSEASHDRSPGTGGNCPFEGLERSRPFLKA